jgi:hypothetical protein
LPGEIQGAALAAAGQQSEDKQRGAEPGGYNALTAGTRAPERGELHRVWKLHAQTRI